MKLALTDNDRKAFRPILVRGVLLFLAISLGIGAAGIWYYGSQEKLRLADYGRQLSAISDLKIQQIQNWRRERLGDGLLVSRNPGLFSILKSLQARPKPAILDRGFRDWLDTYRQAFGYRGVLLFGAQGEIIYWTETAAAGKVRPGLLEAVSQALRTGAASLTDIDFSGPDRADMDVVAPVLDPEGNGRPVGVVAFDLDPGDFLYPLIQAWPTPSESAETLLVRREGEDVVYLNELRHRKNTAGRLRFPLSKPGLPAASAVLGHIGLMEGRDYREIPALADRKPVPDSPWFLIAKVDLDEIYLPLRFEGRILLLLCLALIAAVGTATGYLIRREQVRHLRMERNEQRERLKAEAARVESEDKFRHVFEYSVIGKSITLPGGEVQVNKAFCDMLGYSREEMESRRWQEISHPDEIAMAQRILDAMVRGEKDFARFQKRYFHKSGAVVWADIATSIRRDPAGRPLYFITAALDITERKRAEEEILRLNAELERRVVLRTAQLEEANRELEAFSYSVSHDLRAPLRIVDGFSQALLEDYADRIDEAGRDYLNRIRANAQFMGGLIDDMLMLARLSKADIHFEKADLSALARESAAVVALAHPGRAVDLDVADGLTARGDPRLLRAVFDNLFDNAWKFTSRTPLPRVEFGAVETGGETAYFVRDNGVGFDMKYAGKLFVAFQRLHDRSEFPGTGVGLATVQRIVRRLGGRAWAEGREGLGATFFFTLNETERRIG